MLRRRDFFKRHLFATALISIGLFSAGMGGVGEEDPTRIPEPAHNFSATVVDQRDISSNITLISFEGQTFVTGRRGGAMISIPFENMKEIEFRMIDADLYAMITMKGESQIDLRMEKGRILYGRLPYGHFAIKIRDIRKIILHGPTKQER